MIGCWGIFVGLFPPAFLQDEVDALDRRDFALGGALAIVCLIVPIIVVPTMTSTIVSAWTDRAFDAERLNLQQNRPEVADSSARVADYYAQRGVIEPEAAQLASTVLGTSVHLEAASQGIQAGLRFLSITVGGLGLLGDWRFDDSKFAPLRSIILIQIAAHFARVMSQDVFSGFGTLHPGVGTRSFMINREPRAPVV